MSRITEAETFPDEEVHILPCEGIGCEHYVKIEWDNVTDDMRWLSICAAFTPNDWRSRIKNALRILRGKELERDGVLLNQHSVNSLRTFLNDKAAP